MLDIKLFRDNPKLIRENLKKKFQDKKIKLVDEIITLDETWRKDKFYADNLRKERNIVSEKINVAKKSKDEKTVKELIKRAQEIPQKIKTSEEETMRVENKIKEFDINPLFVQEKG
ncbi:MAG: hypothetical protein AABX16_04560, partial [Nanoarchaeota archaeon]